MKPIAELRGKLIFAVEDNVLNRIVFQMSLMTHGVRVEFERFGPDAVYHLSRFQAVDLIILDLMLYNGISGYDVYTQIRKLPNFQQTPIIAVSAAEPSTAIPKAKALGFSGFISKPIDEDIFPYQLAKIMEGEEIWLDNNYKPT
jgi:CheY-like chemotaxis protein